MTLTFVSVVMRYVVGGPIPDNFDFARLVTGIMVFWGIASTCYHGEQIQMDALWFVLGKSGRRALDVFATLIALGFIGLLSVLLVGRVEADIADQTGTLNLGVVIWPFHLVASIGMAAAMVLLVVRLTRLVRGAEPVPHDDGGCR